MSNERRVVVFMLATFTSIMAINFAMEKAGLLPPPPPPKPRVEVAKVEPAVKPAASEPAKPEASAKPSDESARAETPTPTDGVKAAIPLAKPSELVLGSTKAADGYLLEVQLDQRGAGVVSVSSAVYHAEYDGSKPSKAPLDILQRDNLAPLSLSMALSRPSVPSASESERDERDAEAPPTAGAEIPLDSVVWEVVRDERGRAVRPTEKGQEAILRATVDELGLTVTKTYRLNKGAEAFDVVLTFDSPAKSGTVSYRLLGPHGIPIEGEWYTGTFRDVVFGQVDGNATRLATLSAYDVAKKKGDPERFAELPLKFAGVENQYFTSILLPWPPPSSDEKRWDSEARTVLIHEHPTDKQKSDVGVEVWSRPLNFGPNVPITHTYKVYAGAKTAESLAPYGAEDLASYRKSWAIPFATFFAKTIITPLLGMTYGLTKWVSGLFGGTKGNYGIAIMLLTAIVRLGMFPLSRKQAISAKKMQDLQPYMKEVQEKYKDDKEAQTRETFALYRKHGVNPVGGCLPALIQLPIFVGLWQALNNSVGLR
ncbi:MAG: membrane protein insertase YidC, partial [Isosphaeraceae bacterium]